MNEDVFTIYSMSDSTGQTSETLAKAAVRQFRDVQEIRHIPLPRITRAEQILKILQVLDQSRPCMITYTLSIPSLRDVMVENSKALNIELSLKFVKFIET